jgi:hypothetical protein
MGYNLVKYDNVLAVHRPVDPTSDIFGFRAVNLNGVQFDDSNIATISMVSDLESAYNALLLAFNNHEFQQGVDLTEIRNNISDLSGLISALGAEVNAINSDKPLEENIISTASQIDFTASTIRWSASNADFDVEVYRNGQKLVQDATGTNQKDFIKMGHNQIRLTDPCVAGEQITIRMCRPNLNIVAKDFFRWDANGISGRTITPPQTYAIGTNKTALFRNGLLMLKSLVLGNVADRYEETTSRMLSVVERLISTDVITVLNRDENIARRDVDGVSGTLISGLDSYSDDRLVAYRNGLVMTKSIDANIPSLQRYAETSATSITLTESADIDEVFSFEVLTNNPVVEEHVNFTGFTITLGDDYEIGANRLFLYRNGKLMTKGTSLGDPVDQYSESTANTLTLQVGAELTDWFHVIYKAAP